MTFGGKYLKTTGRVIGTALFLTLAPYSEIVEAKKPTRMEVIHDMKQIESKLKIRRIEKRENKYSLRGDLTLKIPEDIQTPEGIYLPVSIHHLLCFDYKNLSNCPEWNFENLPNLPAGELEREIQLGIFTDLIYFKDGGKTIPVKISDTKPYYLVRVNTEGGRVYWAKHFLR